MMRPSSGDAVARHRARRAVVLTLIAPMLVVLAACGGDASEAEADSDSAALLFTVTSGGSRVKAAEDGGYRLLLDHVDDHSIWFTDRPDRDSGVLETGNLVGSWGAFGFDEDPPNVALIAHDGAGVAETAVVTMTNPQYDTAYRVMTADITFVDSAPEFTPAPGGEVELGQLSLFVDDATVQIPAPSDGASDASASGSEWDFHSIIPSGPDADRYVAKYKVNDRTINSGDNLIYSIPTVDLVSDFEEHHLTPPDTGLTLNVGDVSDGS
jgi:hypothetical protein